MVKQIDKREEKYKRISIAIEKMPVGSIIAPSTLARSVGVHPQTLTDLFDLIDSLKEIGFETTRDSKTGKIKNIHRVNDSLNLKKEVAEMKKELIDIGVTLEEIKIKIKR